MTYGQIATIQTGGGTIQNKIVKLSSPYFGRMLTKNQLLYHIYILMFAILIHITRLPSPPHHHPKVVCLSWGFESCATSVRVLDGCIA